MEYELLSYAATNSVFPHDSTGDQFFDDGKYCAYSALGRELGKQVQTAMSPPRDGAPTTFVGRVRHLISRNESNGKAASTRLRSSAGRN